MEALDYFEAMFRLAIDGEARGVWFWAAVYTLLLCLYSTVYQVRTRFWPHTRGELLTAGVKKFGAGEWALSEQEYVLEAGYRYRVSGVEYTGRRVSPWVIVASHNLRGLLARQIAAIPRDPDGGVTVFYNPRNPGKSLLIVASRSGIGITLAIALLPMAAYGFVYHG